MLRNLTTRIPRHICTTTTTTTTTTRRTHPTPAMRAFSTQRTGGGGGGGNRGSSSSSSSSNTAAVSRPTSSSQVATPRSPAPITGLSRLLDDFASTDIFSDPFFRPFFAGPGRGLMNPLTTALQKQQQQQLQQLDMGLDIAETEQEYIVKAEVPGVAKEDVKVTFQEGILNITAERKEEHVEEDTKHTRHYSDFSYGKVSRSLRVPDAADKEQIDAQLDNGVLTVKIKKGEHAKETVVPVK